MATRDIAPQVRDYLKKLRPLCIVRFKDIYDAIATSVAEEHAVRTALYSCCAGSPVSERKQSKTFYAIRMVLKYAGPSVKKRESKRKEREEEVLLALPGGVPREQLLQVAASAKGIADIKKQLEAKYGTSVIGFWVTAAERRSVDQARPAMRAASRRDKSCRLCAAVNELRESAGLRSVRPEVMKAHHLIPRELTFWTVLASVDAELERKEKGRKRYGRRGGRRRRDLFSNGGATMIVTRLKADPFHSDRSYIIGLCDKHDTYLQAQLQKAVN